MLQIVKVIKSRMAEHVGRQFGNYALTRLLGKGGFAEVYLGEHVYLKSLAAIKVLLTTLGVDETDRFLTEARTLAALKHPHIVRILDFGSEGAIPFLVMEYAPNGTMQQRYPRGTVLAPDLVVPYVSQVASALQYAHDQKLVHRDIKPGNLLLQDNNDLLLSDFGVAMLAQTSQQSNSAIIGTATYMPPEQIRGKARPASDQYALGVMAYEWLSGDYLFQGSFSEVCAQHMYAVPPSLRNRVPTLSPAIEQAVMTALAKDPSQRFANVQAFATALAEAAGLSSIIQVVPKTQQIQDAPTQLENLVAGQEFVSSSFDSPFVTEAIATEVIIPQPDSITQPEELPQPPVPVTHSTSSTLSSQITLQIHLPQHLPSLKGLLILLVLLVVVLSGSGWLYYAYAGMHQSGSPQNRSVATRQTPPTSPAQIVQKQSTATPTPAPAATPTPPQSLVAPPTPAATPRPSPTLLSTPASTPTPTSKPAATPPPKPTPKPVCPPTVQSGSTGAWVKTLQQDLNSRGMTDQNGKPLVVDGNFGPMTLYAVKTWQKKAGTTVDGVVGPLSWHTLGQC
jgi:serine/threonine protein kinase